MRKSKLLQRLRLLSHIAPLVGTVSAVIMAGAAIYTALVIKHTADIATGEFALARKPAVFLTELEPKLKMNPDGSGAKITLFGVLREVREVPTTVHEVRVGHYFGYESHNEARWRSTGWRDIPLYGDHLTRPMVLGFVDIDKAIVQYLQKERRLDEGVYFSVFFKVEYRLSIQGGEQEKWRVHVSVKCAGDGTCTAREPPMPEIESVRKN